jgi:hypothetical protein
MALPGVVLQVVTGKHVGVNGAHACGLPSLQRHRASG